MINGSLETGARCVCLVEKNKSRSFKLQIEIRCTAEISRNRDNYDNRLFDSRRIDSSSI